MGDLAVSVFSATQLVESNTLRLTDVFGTTSKYISGMQVDDNKEANIVLPVAQHPLKWPAKNRYQSKCKKGEIFSKEDYYHPCKPCSAGSYSNTINAEACIPCNIRFYGDKEGMDECLKCPGHTTTMEGLTPGQNCQCVNGYFNIQLALRRGAVSARVVELSGWIPIAHIESRLLEG